MAAISSHLLLPMSQVSSPLFAPDRANRSTLAVVASIFVFLFRLLFFGS